MFWTTLWSVLKNTLLNTAELLFVIAIISAMYLPAFLISRPFRKLPQKCADKWQAFRSSHPGPAPRFNRFTEPMLDFCLASVFLLIVLIVFFCSGGSFLRFLQVWFPGADIPTNGAVTDFSWSELFTLNGYDGIRNSVICEMIMCAAMVVYSVVYKIVRWILHLVVRADKGKEDDRETVSDLIGIMLPLAFTCLLTLQLPAVMRLYQTKAIPMFNIFVALYNADYDMLAGIGVWNCIGSILIIGIISYWLLQKALRSGFLVTFMGFAICGQMPTKYNYGWYIAVFLLLGIVLELFFMAMQKKDEEEIVDDLLDGAKKTGIKGMLVKSVFPVILMVFVALVFGILALLLALF